MEWTAKTKDVVWTALLVSMKMANEFIHALGYVCGFVLISVYASTPDFPPEAIFWGLSFVGLSWVVLARTINRIAARKEPEK